jgi:hypothetical protein
MQICSRSSKKSKITSAKLDKLSQNVWTTRHEIGQLQFTCHREVHTSFVQQCVTYYFHFKISLTGVFEQKNPSLTKATGQVAMIGSILENITGARPTIVLLKELTGRMARLEILQAASKCFITLFQNHQVF